MSSKNKTTETELNVYDFIDSFVDNQQKKEDSLHLIKLMEKWSSFKPKMWGPSIIGFGTYHYKYISGHEGDSMLIGFSPRKAQFSLYVTLPSIENKQLIERLGHIKMGKACIYFKKLSDINIEVLELICKTTIQYIKEQHQ